jgi:hypothetical protein
MLYGNLLTFIKIADVINGDAIDDNEAHVIVIPFITPANLNKK